MRRLVRLQGVGVRAASTGRPMNLPSSQLMRSVLMAAGDTTPCYSLQSRNIEPLHTPQKFLDALHSGIQSAQERITLAALYWGTGDLEAQLVQALMEACKRRPTLQVSILLDHSRGLRGRSFNSITMLSPLLDRFPRQVKVSLFRMPQLQGIWGRILPSPLNEVMAVSHVKAGVFDDTLIMTGANLSHSYFTQRQDRYTRFENAHGLTAFYHGLIDLLGRFAVGPPGRDNRPPALPFSTFNTAWRQFLSDAVDRQPGPTVPDTNDSPPAKGNELPGEGNVYATPSLQFAPLGVRHDEAMLRSLLRSAPPHMHLTLATAYLNPTPDFLKDLQGWPGSMTLVGPSQETHGFADARGAKAVIPKAYAVVEADVLDKLGRRMMTPLPEAYEYNAFQAHRYVRDGWTYHGKGLWLSPEGPNAPSMYATVVGSSNYGFRSFERDLESQIFLFTACPSVGRRWAKERDMLLQHCQPVDASQSRQKLLSELSVTQRRWLPPLARAIKGLL